MKYCNECQSELFSKVLNEFTPEQLIKKISHVLNVPVGYIVGNNRTRRYCEARHIIADILYNIYGLSYFEIGELLGGRNHSTIINSVNSIMDWCNDDEYRVRYINIHKLIFGHSKFMRYDDNFYKKKYKNKKYRMFVNSI